MFLSSESSAPEDREAPNAQASNNDVVASSLTTQVRSAFPNLQFSSAIVEERGGDHRVLLLDQNYAFRFPREAMHHLDVEIAVLAALRPRCEIAVPEYRFVDPAGQFAGYRFITGDELTPQRFAALATTIRHRVLDQAGRFLAALHGLAPVDVLPAPRWPVIATATGQIADARARRLPQIARAFPKLAQSIGAFFDECPRELVGRQVVLHGDLVDDHILLARDGRGLAGIIDFGDVALGDPAHDLLGFWAYGSDAVTRVIAAYQPGESDDLHRRSHRAFIRYRIERFAELLAAGGRAAAQEAATELAMLLSAPDLPGVRNIRQITQDNEQTKGDGYEQSHI